MTVKCILSRLFARPRTGMPDEQREGLQEELIDIILRVLKKNPQLHYYQGYHDIVVTFLLVLGERLATALVEKLSTHHLRYPATSCRTYFFSPRDQIITREVTVAHELWVC